MAMLKSMSRVHVRHAGRYTRYILRTLRLFRRPLWVLSAYLRREPMPGSVVELRDGTRIALSGDPLDIVTVFVVFVRRDYGDIAPGSRVVDVGANIGVFTVFAAWCGAARVVAYEPSGESFACLERNIELNGLRSRVTAVRAAVVGRAGAPVPFAVRSSVFNALGQDVAESELVPTIDLDGIIASEPHVDLLKLDCEGNEAQILGRASPAAMRAIGAIRLEYHGDERQGISQCLARHGFASRVPENAEARQWYGWFTAGARS